MRVLVVRAGALGDLLLLRPTVASLRAAGAAVTLLAPLLPGSALVGTEPDDAQALLGWDSYTALALRDPHVERAQLGELFGGFDVALCYSRDTELAERLKAIASRVVVHDPRPQGRAADWYARPLAALGIERREPGPLRAANEVIDVRLPRRFLAVHPGSGSPRKNWPPARFAEVARQCASGAWLLSLGPADESAASALAGEADAVVTRDLPPRRLAALLSQAGAYVGNDSGVTHLAAACGIPTVALFGPSDPAIWTPVGPHVRIVRAPDGTMASITVDAVVGAISMLQT